MAKARQIAHLAS